MFTLLRHSEQVKRSEESHHRKPTRHSERVKRSEESHRILTYIP